MNTPVCNIVYDQDDRNSVAIVGFADRRFIIGVLERQKNNDFKVQMGAQFCREGLVGVFARIGLWKSKQPVYLMLRHDKASNKNFHQDVDASLRVLNTLESQSGWPLSEKMDIRMNGQKTFSHKAIIMYNRAFIISSENTIVIRSSPKWKRAPFLMSLLALLLRNGRLFKKPLAKCKDKDVLSIVKKVVSASKSMDGRYMYQSLKYWVPLTKHHDKIFRGISNEKLWKGTAAPGVYRPGLLGITNWTRDAVFNVDHVNKTRRRAQKLAQSSVVMEVEGQ